MACPREEEEEVVTRLSWSAVRCTGVGCSDDRLVGKTRDPMFICVFARYYNDRDQRKGVCNTQ